MCVKETRYFLIDSENTNYYNFLTEYDVNDKDKLIIFYSKDSLNISIENIMKIEPFKKKYFKVESDKSKESMDFNITMYAGYLVGKGKRPENIFIVSDDNGFEAISTLLPQLRYKSNVNFIKQNIS